MFKKLKKRKNRQAIKRNLPSRKVLIILTVAVILCACLILIGKYLYNSPEFIIKEVDVVGEGVTGSYLSEELSHVGLGENIFAINIKDTERSIKNDYFEVKDICVERTFPNRLIFHVNRRKTTALISSGYYYPVDKEGVILKDVSRTGPDGLPVIRGVYLTRRDIGKKCSSPKLVKSLILLEELSKSKILESYNVSIIDAASSNNLSFYIDDGLQIKIGGGSFADRLKLLEKVLDDPDVDLMGIRYIDLRFKDVIIGPK